MAQDVQPSISSSGTRNIKKEEEDNDDDNVNRCKRTGVVPAVVPELYSPPLFPLPLSWRMVFLWLQLCVLLFDKCRWWWYC